MLGFLLGLHGGYTNTRVFFACGTAELMESTKVHWPPREELRPGR